MLPEEVWRPCVCYATEKFVSRGKQYVSRLPGPRQKTVKDLWSKFPRMAKVDTNLRNRVKIDLRVRLSQEKEYLFVKRLGTHDFYQYEFYIHLFNPNNGEFEPLGAFEYNECGVYSNGFYVIRYDGPTKQFSKTYFGSQQKAKPA